VLLIRFSIPLCSRFPSSTTMLLINLSIQQAGANAALRVSRGRWFRRWQGCLFCSALFSFGEKRAGKRFFHQEGGWSAGEPRFGPGVRKKWLWGMLDADAFAAADAIQSFCDSGRECSKFRC